MNQRKKHLIIVAGPNGAGKTTFVHKAFPEFVEQGAFINADHFARDLYPENVEKVSLKAGKIFLSHFNKFLLETNPFVIETTLSGSSLLQKISKARENGFKTTLVFLWITSVELCDFRVKGRVAAGGHNIPIDVIQRRYKRGLQNFKKYLEIVDECKVFLADTMPKLVFEKELGHPNIVMPDLHAAFLCDIERASE